MKILSVTLTSRYKWVRVVLYSTLDGYLLAHDICTIPEVFIGIIWPLNPGFAESGLCPAFANSEDPYQLAEEANWYGFALFVISMWICINTLDKVIWLAEN